MPGTMDALRRLAAAGFQLVIVTNQAGVERGLVSERVLEEIHGAMLLAARRAGARLDAIYVCPHLPVQACSCRKPEPGLVVQAAEDLAIDLKKSFMIGDSPSDIEAGRRAGCTTIGVVSDQMSFTATDIPPDFIADSLATAAQIACSVSRDWSVRQVAPRPVSQSVRRRRPFPRPTADQGG